tara:strand:+ start:735 stop:962 length:228 start_codon:yes stop_codon:yes gene_type:complete
MIITRKDPISKKINSLKIPITQKQLSRIENRFKTDELIQDIVPELTASQREFLMTGITEETWSIHIKEEDDAQEH